MKRIVVTLLAATLMTWVPCSCLGGCMAPGDCSEEVSGASCCHPNGQQGDAPCSSESDCCCDQGLCKPVLVATAKVQKVDLAPQDLGIFDSPVLFARLESESKVFPCPSTRYILPISQTGYPYPGLSSLQI